MTRCLICKTKFNHPVRRGRRARFCSPECRVKHRKEWRKLYDAQDYVRVGRGKRMMAKYNKQGGERQVRQLRREKEKQERLARLGL